MVTAAPESQQRKLGIELLTQFLPRVYEERRRLFALQIGATVWKSGVDLDFP